MHLRMSIYSNAATHGGSSTYRTQSHSSSHPHRSQGSGQIYGVPNPNIGRPMAAGFQGYQQGPPVGADPQLWQWFQAVDADRSGAITVSELQTALVNGNWSSKSDFLIKYFSLDKLRHRSLRLHRKSLPKPEDLDSSLAIRNKHVPDCTKYLSLSLTVPLIRI